MLTLRISALYIVGIVAPVYHPDHLRRDGDGKEVVPAAWGDREQAEVEINACRVRLIQSGHE